MKYNKFKLATKILAIITICLISFVGIYVQKKGQMVNIVKDYKQSKDLAGYREITFDVSDATKVLDSTGNVVGNTDTYDDDAIKSNNYTKSDEKVNSDDVLNEENYNKVQKIMEKRLIGFGVYDYNFSIDKQNGKIYMQVPEDSETDSKIANLAEIGDFKIKDSKDGTELLNDNNIKSAKTVYNQDEKGTVVYLEIQLDKQGAEKLEDLSTNKYATKSDENSNTTNTTEESNTTTENTAENNTTSENEEEENSSDKSDEKSSEETDQNKVDLIISGSKILSTSFDEPLKDGKIYLTMNNASKDQDEIQNYTKSASRIATLLNNGALPITYKMDRNQFVSTDITKQMVNKALIVAGVIFGLLLIYMIIKYKSKGLLSVISFIGFLATFLLVLRYANVEISIETIVAIIVALGLNYALNMYLLKLKPENKKQFNKNYLNVILRLIPVTVIAIVFCFTKWTILATFGMTMFWGILLILIYNILVTKYIVNE